MRAAADTSCNPFLLPGYAGQRGERAAWSSPKQRISALSEGASGITSALLTLVFVLVLLLTWRQREGAERHRPTQMRRMRQRVGSHLRLICRSADEAAGRRRDAAPGHPAFHGRSFGPRMDSTGWTLVSTLTGQSVMPIVVCVQPCGRLLAPSHVRDW